MMLNNHSLLSLRSPSVLTIDCCHVRSVFEFAPFAVSSIVGSRLNCSCLPSDWAASANCGSTLAFIIRHASTTGQKSAGRQCLFCMLVRFSDRSLLQRCTNVAVLSGHTICRRLGFPIEALVVLSSWCLDIPEYKI